MFSRTLIGRISYELDLKLFDKINPKVSKLLCLFKLFQFLMKGPNFSFSVGLLRNI